MDTTITIASSLDPELVRRYRVARNTWARDAMIRRAAEVLGMSEREYCDRLVQQAGLISFTSNSATPSYVYNPDDAFARAGEQGA